MPVTASDLVIYGSANMQETDSGTQGGAIDTTIKIVFDDAALANAPNGPVKTRSTHAADTTQTITVYGRNSGGSLLTEAMSLAGTGWVQGTGSFERVLKCVVNNSHAGTVILANNANATIGQLESGVLTLRRPFYNVTSTDTALNYYEKAFIRNINASGLSLLSAVVKEYADPGGNITFDLESSVNGSNTSTNRLTAPVGGMLGSFDNANKNVPGTDLAAAAGIGVWMRLALASGQAPGKNTYTVQISGSTI